MPDTPPEAPSKPPNPRALQAPANLPSPRSPEPAPELGELSLSEWHAHVGKMTGVSFLTIARRLPALVSQAVRLAWRPTPVTPVTIV